MAAGAVPLYWGCDRVGDALDSGGLLRFETREELAALLAALSPELYAEMLPAARRNWELLTAAYANMSPLQQVGRADSPSAMALGDGSRRWPVCSPPRVAPCHAVDARA